MKVGAIAISDLALDPKMRGAIPLKITQARESLGDTMRIPSAPDFDPDQTIRMTSSILPQQNILNVKKENTEKLKECGEVKTDTIA